MDFGLYFLWGEYLLDYALFVDQICCAEYADGSSAASHLLAPASHFLQHGSLGVGNERELQALCLSKFLLQLLSVLADAYDLISRSSQFGLVCLKRASLGGASAGICLWIAVKHYLATTVVAALDLASVLVDAKDLGNLISNCDNSKYLFVNIYVFNLYHIYVMQSTVSTIPLLHQLLVDEVGFLHR